MKYHDQSSCRKFQKKRERYLAKSGENYYIKIELSGRIRFFRNEEVT